MVSAGSRKNLPVEEILVETCADTLSGRPSGGGGGDDDDDDDDSKEL
jgi:hypothetical protein